MWSLVDWLDGGQKGISAVAMIWRMSLQACCSPRTVGSRVSGPLGGRPMPPEEKGCSDGSWREKWALGKGSAESTFLTELPSQAPAGGISCCCFCIAISLGKNIVLWSLLYRAAGSWALESFSVAASCLPAGPSMMPKTEEVSNKYL